MQSKKFYKAIQIGAAKSYNEMSCQIKCGNTLKDDSVIYFLDYLSKLNAIKTLQLTNKAP